MTDDVRTKRAETVDLDKLRFENGKRQVELSELQQRLSLMQYQEGRNNDDWEEGFEERSRRGGVAKHSFKVGYQSDKERMDEERRLVERIKQLREEIRIIKKRMETNTEVEGRNKIEE